MSRQLRHKWQAPMYFSKNVLFKKTGLNFCVWIFRAAFPRSKTKLQTLDCRHQSHPWQREPTQAGLPTLPLWSWCLKQFHHQFSVITFFVKSTIEAQIIQLFSYVEILIELDSNQPKASICWCNPWLFLIKRRNFWELRP